MPDPLLPSLTTRLRHGHALRSRGVSDLVHHRVLQVPTLPARLTRDCAHEVAALGMEPGDVEALSLTRARARWPDYRACVQAVAGWARTLGLTDALAQADVALMACHGARYHHDAAQYGGMAFCNLFLNDTPELDLHFPYATAADDAHSTGLRIPLARGTVVVFDTAQPHAVILRTGSGFSAADFAPGSVGAQLFLTWELPITHPAVAQALGVCLDTAQVNTVSGDDEHLWRNGAPCAVHPQTGQWCRADSA